MAALLRQAVLDAGLPEDRIHTVTDEVAAAHAGVDLAAPGDLVVVLVDRVRWSGRRWRNGPSKRRTSRCPPANGYSSTSNIPPQQMPRPSE